MSASTLDKLLIIGGMLSLFHAGYSSAQYRVYLRLIEAEFTGSVPLDILLQSLLSLAVTCAGIVRAVGKFKPIRAADDLKHQTWETVGYRPAFATFAHRVRSLPCE